MHRLLHSMRSMAWSSPNANAQAFTLNAEHGLEVAKRKRTGFYTQCRAWLGCRQMLKHRLLHSMQGMAWSLPNANTKAFILNAEHGLDVAKRKRTGFYTQCGAWLGVRQTLTQRLLHSMRSMAWMSRNANAQAFTLNAEHG